MDNEYYSVCEICKREMHDERIIGCCDGKCKIDTMCNSCATWIEDDEEWLCPECYNNNILV